MNEDVMSKQRSLEHLLLELRHLSGITMTTVGEDVDWFVRTDGMDDDAISTLREAEGQSKPVDSSLKETVKGTLDGLAERLKGLNDFVEMGKMNAVVIGIDKVIEDAQALSDNISSPAAKAKQDKKVRDRKDREGKATQDTGEGKSSKDDQKPSKDSQSQQGAHGGSQSQGAKDAASADGAESQGESYVMVGSEIIESINDPFGLGPQFLLEIQRDAGIKE